MSEAGKGGAQEVINCSCVEIGSIIDGSECRVEVLREFPDRGQAEQALAYLSEKARAVESEPCVIESSINPAEQGVVLQAAFEFACQAEAMIFQLSTR